MVSVHAASPSSAKCMLHSDMLSSTHSLTACVGWRCVQALANSSVSPTLPAVVRLSRHHACATHGVSVLDGSTYV